MAIVLGLVPARGGSKGIPGKNIKLLGGKPLLQWTADAARDAGIFTRTVLTTDSEEIAAAGRRCGLEVPFLRPPELAQDNSAVLPVVQHALGALEGFAPDFVFLLQPTAPFREPAQLREALALLESSGADSVVSVVRIPAHFSPHYAMKVTDDGRLVNFLPEGVKLTRRQDAPAAYSRNGSFYAFRTESFRKLGSIYGERSLPFVMSEAQSVNIDTPADWEEAERVLARRG